jgi:TM2 domain-containing membrane protein YozV
LVTDYFFTMSGIVFWLCVLTVISVILFLITAYTLSYWIKELGHMVEFITFLAEKRKKVKE